MDPASPELKALLRRCREAPADDTPRLVLADWLDEQGDADRAAFIRVQLALSHPSADCGRHRELKSLERGLLAAHAEEWTGELNPILNGLHYGRDSNRGLAPFPPRAQPAAVPRNLPFRRGLLGVRFVEPTWLLDPALRAWMRSPAGEWLERVGLVGMTPDAFARIEIPPEYTGRIDLHLRKRGQEFAELSAFGPGRLSSHDEFSPQDWRHFFDRPSFRTVRSISAEAGVSFLRALGEADVGRLAELEFRCLAESVDLARIVATIPFASLAALDFGPVTAAALREIVASPYLRNLAEWNLIGSPIGDSGMIALCESPLAQSLTAVSFPNTDLGDAGLRALVWSPIFANMNSPNLNLMMNRIGDAGVQTLAESEHLLRYRELVLRENSCGDGAAAALAASEFAANLTYVDFWKNRLGDAGAVALSRSSHLGKIVDLCVKENAIGADGAAALFERFGERAKI